MSELDAVPQRVPYEHFRLRAEDGASLAATSVGRGPAVLIANGIGLTTPVLDGLVDRLRDRYRVVQWDYRGVGHSRLPSRSSDLSIERHARDALRVLDALRIERAAVLGWSMGVPVGLEMIRRRPSRVVAFAALFGTAGRAFHGAVPDVVADAVRLGFLASRHLPAPAHLAVRLGHAMPPLAWLVCRSIRFVGGHTPKPLFHRCVAAVADADRSTYMRTLAHLVEHDARDVLAQLRCPMLVVAGRDDWVTPPEAAREMATLAPGAELIVLEDTSHFGVMEHGPALWQPLEALLARAFSSSPPPDRSGSD